MRKSLLVGIVFLISCGGPKYAVKYSYIPGSDYSCLKECQRERSSCVNRCEERYNRCVLSAQKRAFEVYKRELSNYRRRLDEYNRLLEIYQRELSVWSSNYEQMKKDYAFFREICLKEKNSYACSRADELKKKLREEKYDRPIRPLKPVPPDLGSIISKLSSICKKDCCCEELYNSCFVSCGGKLILYRFCVENCRER